MGNVKRVLVVGRLLGGLGMLVGGVLLFWWLSTSNTRGRTAGRGFVAAILLIIVGPVTMVKSYARGCARDEKELADCLIIYPIEALETVKSGVTLNKAEALSGHGPVNRQNPAFTFVRGKYCKECGEVALVRVGELRYSRPNDERSAKYTPQTEEIELTGSAAQAIKRTMGTLSPYPNNRN